jgi:predicted RND superfamily exporter protein
LDRRLREEDVRDAGVVGTFGLASLLPDPAVAPARLASTGGAVADRVVADFRAAVADSLFDPAAFVPYERFLRTLLNSPAAPTIADLRRFPSLAESILPAARSAPATTSASNQNRASEAITLVFLREATEQRAGRDATVAAVRAQLRDVPGATLTGISVLNHDIELGVRRDLPRLTWAAVIAVALYLILHFRSVADCLLAMLPTVFGMVCFLAFMRLADQKLNMINLVAFPLLIGIDVDYGIYLVSAARHNAAEGMSRDEMARRLTPATSAVLLSAASTIIGFGSLASTSLPAVRSLGWAVGAGIAACVVATFFLSLPLIFILQSRRGRKETR